MSTGHLMHSFRTHPNVYLVSMTLRLQCRAAGSLTWFEEQLDFNIVSEGDRPGRVATLIREAGAVCWGTAYRVAPERADEVLARLDDRDRNGH